MRDCENKNPKPESREASPIVAEGNLERRRAVRFQLQAPVVLEWNDLSGLKRESAGQIRDISIFGAFVICGDKPPSDAFVSLDVQLPPLEKNAVQRLRLKASGKVARTAENGEGVGVAMSARFSLQEVAPASSPCLEPHHHNLRSRLQLCAFVVQQSAARLIHLCNRRLTLVQNIEDQFGPSRDA
jgi:hypothetical protein